MAVGSTQYGDISPRTAAWAVKELLTRGMPFLLFEKFGQAKTLPARNSTTLTFRRYSRFDTTPKILIEGVTPSPTKVEYVDVSCTCVQYGDRAVISDVIQDTHEDDVLKEVFGMEGEQAAIMIEEVRFGIIKAGTSALFSNGALRTSVNTPITLDVQRRAVRTLKANFASPITRVLRSTPNFGTANVAPAFIGMVHTDLEGDIRELPGFVPAEEYGSMTPYESELGKCEGVRYCTSQVLEPWADGGAAYLGSGVAMRTTTGVSADVYPALIVGQNAYAIVALKGKFAITPTVVIAKPSDSDPQGQRNHVAWKSMQTAVITNDDWMTRIECAATE